MDLQWPKHHALVTVLNIRGGWMGCPVQEKEIRLDAFPYPVA